MTKSHFTNIKAQVDAIRSDISAASRELSALNKVGPTSAEVSVRANAVVAELARQAIESLPLEACAAPLGEFNATMAAAALHSAGEASSITVAGEQAPIAFPPRSGAMGLIALIHSEGLARVLVAQAEQEIEASGIERLTAAQLIAKRTAVEGTLHALAVREELAVREAGDAGIAINRRADAPPAIVLAPTEALAA